MKNNFKNLKTQKKGFTPPPSFLLPKSCVAGNKKKKNLVGGFTLIEALVGITILLISVIGPLYIAFQGVSLSILAKNQVIASYLAQEGIEFVRFRMNTNSNMGGVGNGLISSGNVYDLSACSWQLNSGNYCIVDVFDSSVGQIFNCFPYSGGPCPYIKYDDTKKQYGYVPGDETFFRRSIRIDHQPTLGVNDTEFQVESKVEWGRPGDLHSIVIKEVIRDWRP